MKTTKRISIIVCLLLLVAAGALAANSHWTVNPRAYQYDMTVYAKLTVMRQGDYEVAAFCGGECRGVGKLLTAGDGTQMFQLRIWSNASAGETISFRVYLKAEDREQAAEETVMFQSQTVVGTPSNPLSLKVIQTGDVNGDGLITAQDASLVLQLVAGKLGRNDEGIVSQAADVNGDGLITAQDASLVLQFVAGKIKELSARERRQE